MSRLCSAATNLYVRPCAQGGGRVLYISGRNGTPGFTYSEIGLRALGSIDLGASRLDSSHAAKIIKLSLASESNGLPFPVRGLCTQ
jgi:hypothetical protein